ncbi:MAG: hypothetical protein QM597_08590 [Aeromicrobium sp.]|uniref:DUF7507 domain-containing protein n=1 Tax=Aeromicrobium sp. TaxID=1871063 RepID=UPI0039E58445
MASLRRFASLAAVTAVVGVSLAVVATPPAPATALPEPGHPGVSSAPDSLFLEDFENGFPTADTTAGTGSGAGLIGDYESAQEYDGTPVTYSAEGQWVNPSQLNGIVLAYNSLVSEVWAVGGYSGTGSTAAINLLRGLAQSLGTLYNTRPGDDIDVDENHVVSAWTRNSNPGANTIEVQTEEPIPLPSTGKRFVNFSVDVATLNCATAPKLNFFLVGDLTDDTTQTALNTTPGTGCASGDTAAHASTLTVTGDKAALVDGGEAYLRVRNANGASNGNDHAFDNIELLDVTPQLDKHFGAADSDYPDPNETTALVGGATPLTFTVTNTSELGEKTGWGLTDSLPSGLSIASSQFATTCTAATVTSDGTAALAEGDDTITVTDGSIASGVTSCTITVWVKAETAGDYVNGPAQTEVVGLEEPADATLHAVEADIPATCEADDTRATQRWWYFGNQASIDFGVSGDTTRVVGDSDVATTNGEGTTVVTDTTGDLLFWANGERVLDKNSDPMPNGTGLTTAPSATQTVAAFPAPTTIGKYFVVTTTGSIESGAGELLYSEVDLTANGGLGEVSATNKNLPVTSTLTDYASEALVSAPNADGTGYWVITYTYNQPSIVAFEFDDSGPTGTVVQSLLPTSNNAQFGTLAFSADMTQLVAMTGSSNGGKLRLLTFDADTGQISQKAEWETGDGGNAGYSAAFSPSGDYVYATNIFGTGHLYRYDVSDPTSGAAIKATEMDVTTIGASGGQVQRGADGRMYVANNGSTTLTVVNDPDNASTTASDLDIGSLTLATGTASGFGLPQMVTGCPNGDPLVIDKSSALTTDNGEAGVGNVGDVLTYTFEVTNNSASSVSDVTVEDTFAGLSAIEPVSPATSPVTIASGETVTFTATYTITQADVDAGVIANSATASGLPDGETERFTSESDEDYFVPEARDPELTIEKTSDADGEEVSLGQVITYTFEVENTGNTTLNDVTVNDEMEGLSEITPVSPATSPVTLVPGETATFTATYTVTEQDILNGHVSNSATATGTPPPLTPYPDNPDPDDPEPLEPSDPSTTTTETEDPEQGLTTEKTDELTADTDEDGQADPGDVITYTFVVTNVGNTSLTDVTVNDEMEGLSEITPVSPATAPVELAPGESATFTATYTVTQADIDSGTLTNTATSTGTFTPADGGDPVTTTSPPASITSDTVRAEPALTTVKRAELNDTNGNGVADEGETISYFFEVSNTGNTTLEQVRVIDSRVTGLTPTAVTLAPGESVVITADPYVVTAADAAAGSVSNTATARGQVPGGAEIDSPAATVSTVTSGGILPTTGTSLNIVLWALFAATTVGAGVSLFARRRRVLG